MRSLLVLCLCISLVGCATRQGRRRVFIGTAIAAVAGVGLTATGLALQARDGCSGDCRVNAQVMWSGGATTLFLAGSIAFIQYITKPKPAPEKASLWNFVPQPQPKPQWPPSTTPNPTGPPQL